MLRVKTRVGAVSLNYFYAYYVMYTSVSHTEISPPLFEKTISKIFVLNIYIYKHTS